MSVFERPHTGHRNVSMRSGQDGFVRSVLLRPAAGGGVESRCRLGRASIRPPLLLGLILVTGGVLLLGWWLRPAPPHAVPVTPVESRQPAHAPPASEAPLPNQPPATALPSPRVQDVEEDPSPQTTLSEPDLIRILRDAGEPLKARRQAARRLARSASPEAMAALKATLNDGPPQLKAAIAEGLGSSPNPEARTLLAS